MLRCCYLSIVQMDMGLRIGRGPQQRRIAMSILMNRILDAVVSFAVVGLTLTIAGATVALGA